MRKIQSFGPLVGSMELYAAVQCRRLEQASSAELQKAVIPRTTTRTDYRCRVLLYIRAPRRNVLKLQRVCVRETSADFDDRSERAEEQAQNSSCEFVRSSRSLNNCNNNCSTHRSRTDRVPPFFTPQVFSWICRIGAHCNNNRYRTECERSHGKVIAAVLQSHRRHTLSDRHMTPSDV